MSRVARTIDCPASNPDSLACVTLAHGEGSRQSRRLFSEYILPALHNDCLSKFGDAAELPRPAGPIAFSTDQFVVSPLFFPGGDIGRLSVIGTTNDLAVAGARPLWLSLSLVLEEGLPLATLQRVLASVADAARRGGRTNCHWRHESRSARCGRRTFHQHGRYWRVGCTCPDGAAVFGGWR